MAKVKKKKTPFGDFEFTKKNYLIFGLGIVLIIIGYLFMIAGGRDGALALVIAPVVLLVSYLILIPFAIMSGILGKDSQKET